MLKLSLVCFAWLFFHAAASGGEPGLLADGTWIKRLRPDHPRLFLNRDLLPQIRERAKSECAPEFAAIKKEVDELPGDAPMIFNPDPVERHPDGSLKVKPGQQGHTLFKYNGGDQAVRCALVYLVTGEEKYAAKAKNYLQLAVRVFQWTAENNIWVDLLGTTRINALAAYDWIHDTMTPEERKAFLLPVLDYLTESQPEGSYKFRRTIGGPEDGNYGERALMYFAGLAGYGDGIDDARCADFIRRGAELFVAMMDHREKTSAGSGLLSAITISYSFGAYPNSTFLFLHSWKSAFGEDLSGRWAQMADYPTWFDFSMIRQEPGQNFLQFGIGDVPHTDNEFYAVPMYTHLAQSIHFYGQKHPEKARNAYAVIAELPEKRRGFVTPYPFLPFLLNNFDAAGIAGAKPPVEPDYFHAPSFGLLIVRSGRGPRDTYASFRFGSSLGNHQHYDELSFVIYKDGFLALDSGSRTETDHHHNFTAQSVAHNTILIHDDNEPMPPFWRSWSYKPDGKTYFNHGGQNSKIDAKMLALESGPGYVYAAGDATKSYADTKSREVVRQFVYIRPDYFVVYDRVASAKPAQKKEFILHFQNLPQKIGEQKFRADHGGRLFVTTLLPENAVIEFVGGPGREFWASGRNWELEGGDQWDKIYKLTGKWRMEVSEAKTVKACRFLHFLQAAVPGTETSAAAEYLKNDREDGVRFTAADGKIWEVWFNRSGEVGCRIETKTSGR
jgi:heparin/heparan-sulfate lyase